AAPGGVSVGRGETVYLAVRQVGGTAGQMFTTPSLLQVTEVVQPVPTYITEKNNTGSGLPETISGAIVRSESAPAWGALGETLLDSPWTDYTAPGWYTYLFGADSRYVYIAGSSAGGGGGGGDGGWDKPGEGGRRGNWAALSLERGVGIPWDVPGLDVYVPAPGAGSPSRETNGSPGEALIVRLSTAPGTVLLNIPGGNGGRLAYGGFFNRDPVGEAQTNYPFFGRLFVGGLAAPKDTNGNSPGGGGGGGDGGVGGNARAGRPGGAGFCAIRTA
ncbi:glycine-rich domain-containing protein, partial [Mycobacteroides abscessus]